MKKLIIMSLFVTPLAYGQFSSSTLDQACKQPGYACGECESTLQNDMNSFMSKITGGGFAQGDHWGDGKEKNKNPANISMAPGVTLDGALKEIMDIFKKNNPAGDNKLNFVVIGESESLQATSVKDGKMYPRIMMKSPNSELMVTFNTDPKAKGYNTIEMMRWNGKQGRYEFQELNFGEGGEKPHVDATGAKCLECHKSPDPRPNWDTYRAWAGVVPSRDDMMEMHGENQQFDKSKGMQPDAKAYLSFLDQMVKDKEEGKKSRIAMLDIPFDEKRQMAEYVKAAGGKKFSPREQLDLIKKQINDKGFYRIKHFPDKDEAEEKGGRMSFNFDGKTANWAGPSQFAFDQMLAQNMCKVTTDLKKHKNFDKFKYPLALMMACGQKNTGMFPESYKKEVLDYYKGNKYSALGDVDPAKKPKTDPSFEDLQQLVLEDTTASHEHANGFKFNRHEKFLKSYLTEVERSPATEAEATAKFYSEKVSTPYQNNFHAIQDVGGVKGVPEASTDELAAIRLLLEPMDVKVSHWSLVHGKNNAYNSFSFSDQFELFGSQPLWSQIRDEAGGCRELEAKAKAALSSPESKKPEVTPESDNVSELALICGSQGKGVTQPLSDDQVAEMSRVLMASLKPDVKKSMSKCLTCHDTDGDIEFPGLSKFVKSDDETEFLGFLNTKSEAFNRPMIEVVQIKLGLLPRPVDGLDYGDNMPPTDWKDNPDFAAKHGLSAQKAQDTRRKQIATFLGFAAAGGSREKLKSFCDKINNDSYIKDFNSGAGKSAPTKAGKQ
jgi:hypothetical protein